MASKLGLRREWKLVPKSESNIEPNIEPTLVSRLRKPMGLETGARIRNTLLTLAFLLFASLECAPPDGSGQGKPTGPRTPSPSSPLPQAR